jgi:hypothetical protein
MKRPWLALALLIGLSACNSNHHEPAVPETAANQQSVISETGSRHAATDTAETAAWEKNTNHLIVPGKSIGLINLNEEAEVVQKLLGKPAKADAAMGKSLQTWFTDRDSKAGDAVAHQTTIYFSRNMGATDENSRVKQIRITSPFFYTQNHLSTKVKLATFRNSFPAAKKTALYTLPRTKEQVTIYDDIKAGIAFETDPAGNCLGITIHEPGKAAFEIYTEVAANLKKL